MTRLIQVATFTVLALLTISLPSQQASKPAVIRLGNGEMDEGEAPVQISEYSVAPFEDRHGRLWFGSAFEGLSRYDGKQLLSFSTKDGLGGKTIREVMEDTDGLLWFATTGGLSLYDGKSFTTLTEYESMQVTRSFGNEGDHREVWDVVKDRQGSLWIATMDGVFRHDGKSFSRFAMPAPAAEHPYEFTPKMVYCLLEDKDGHMWFGTDGAGLVRYDGKTKTVYTKKDNGLCSDRVCTIVQDKRGMYWIGTSDGGVSRFDGTSFTSFLQSKTVSKHMGRGRVMGILEDRTGILWFAASGPGRGVYRYDGKIFRHFSAKEGLGALHVSSLSEDRSGRLWAGTSNGVYRLDGDRFVNITK